MSNAEALGRAGNAGATRLESEDDGALAEAAAPADSERDGEVDGAPVAAPDPLTPPASPAPAHPGAAELGADGGAEAAQPQRAGREQPSQPAEPPSTDALDAMRVYQALQLSKGTVLGDGGGRPSGSAGGDNSASEPDKVADDDIFHFEHKDEEGRLVINPHYNQQGSLEASARGYSARAALKHRPSILNAIGKFWETAGLLEQELMSNCDRHLGQYSILLNTLNYGLGMRAMSQRPFLRNYFTGRPPSSNLEGYCSCVLVRRRTGGRTPGTSP
jgi:hypothetical protein